MVKIPHSYFIIAGTNPIMHMTVYRMHKIHQLQDHEISNVRIKITNLEFGPGFLTEIRISLCN